MNCAQYIFVALMLLFPSIASGQSSRSGQSGMGGAHSDETTSARFVIPPNYIYSWKVSEKLGEISSSPVDTIPYNFQNSALYEGHSASKAYLGNFGSPSHDRIFSLRLQDP
ncbi:MAG: putative porin, partial [Bacteroidales bacterium]